ncbi:MULTISPECIES: DMT family transporter [Aliagarivorans]|uniref:DMT family transporter n=1 Tax=Aliagarivorans TaxID=882379 RepID=UPI0003F9AA1E|nr:MULTISPECIES: DMT family transporter [Aliagarivorans]
MYQLIQQIIPRGAQFMLLSSLGFALMAACVKLLSSQGIPVFEIVAARALVSLVLSYADVRRKRISVFGHNHLLLFARGAVGTLALICVYYAVTVLPLAEATILQYLHPVFTALLALLFLKERVHLSTLLCVAFSLAGLYVMVGPSLSSDYVSELPLLGVGLAVLGAFGSAVAYVIVRQLSNREDASVIIFYFPLVALPVSLLLMGKDATLPTLSQVVLLIMVGIFTQIGQIGLTKAMQTLTAAKATAFGYIQIVFSIVLGIVLFAEAPAASTYAGGALIVLGAMANLFGSTLSTKMRASKR